MKALRVAVIGAGNGGLAVAGCAALAGHRVSLHDIRPEALALVQERGGIEVTGIVSGHAPVALATADLAAAVADAELVVMVVPGPEQGAAAQALAAHLRPGQVLLVKPGCTGGALEVAAVLNAAGRGESIVAEADAFIYACAIKAPGVSAVTAAKKRFGVAAVPAGRTAAALAVIERLFPQAVAAASVLHTGLANMNPVLHVPPMVANAGWVEYAQGAFEFYGDGITPAVARTVAAYDAERTAVAAALGVQVPTLAEWVESTYGVTGPGVYEIVQILQRDVYKSIRAPGTLAHRFLTEDVPCGTVPVADLGESLGVPVPLHQALIQIASLLCEQDFGRHGRTVDKLGLAGLNAAGIRQRVL